MTLNEMFEEHGIYLGSLAFRAIEDVAKAYIQQETELLSKYILELQADKGRLTDELTKAKEIIREFVDFVNLEVEYDPEHPQEHTDLWNELCKKAEAFLKE